MGHLWCPDPTCPPLRHGFRRAPHRERGRTRRRRPADREARRSHQSNLTCRSQNSSVAKTPTVSPSSSSARRRNDATYRPSSNGSNPSDDEMSAQCPNVNGHPRRHEWTPPTARPDGAGWCATGTGASTTRHRAGSHARPGRARSNERPAACPDQHGRPRSGSPARRRRRSRCSGARTRRSHPPSWCDRYPRPHHRTDRRRARWPAGDGFHTHWGGAKCVCRTLHIGERSEPSHGQHCRSESGWASGGSAERCRDFLRPRHRGVSGGVETRWSRGSASRQASS